MFWFDFRKNVAEWKNFLIYKKENLQEDCCKDDPLEKKLLDNEEISLLSTVNIVEYVEAKKKESHNWSENKVYSVVSNSGQNTITRRWICTKRETKVGK